MLHLFSSCNFFFPYACWNTYFKCNAKRIKIHIKRGKKYLKYCKNLLKINLHQLVLNFLYVCMCGPYSSACNSNCLLILEMGHNIRLLGPIKTWWSSVGKCIGNLIFGRVDCGREWKWRVAYHFLLFGWL